MKKLLLIAVVAAVTLVAGCSNSKKADVDDENVAVKTTGDSISMYLGTLYGAQMVQMADSTLNKTEFIDGMKTALNTASMDSLQKMGMALSTGAGCHRSGKGQTAKPSWRNGHGCAIYASCH